MARSNSSTSEETGSTTSAEPSSTSAAPASSTSESPSSTSADPEPSTSKQPSTTTGVVADPIPAPMVPTLGRIVIYVPGKDDAAEIESDTEALPAVIVKVFGDKDAGRSVEHGEVNLKVLNNGHHDLWRTNVFFNDEKDPGSWHWPPRV